MKILRVACALVIVPLLLTALLVGLMDASDGKLGSVSIETFELGLLPIVAAFFAVMLTIFLPLLYLVGKLRRLSPLTSSLVGLLAVLLPFVIFGWSFLSDSKLRWGYRVEQFLQAYPWLLLGAAGGLLFWFIALRRSPSTMESP
jgi:hypothetical protein